MFVIGPIGNDEFNPYIEGRNTNYILSSELPELLTPNSSVTNTLTQTIQTEVTSSDTTLFKAVTYVINLGTLNGEEVKLTQDYSQNSNIPYQYGWTVHGTAGDTKIYCEGYEGYGFPSKLSDLKASYGALQKTNAAGSINQASFDAPEKMIAGEGTIIWN